MMMVMYDDGDASQMLVMEESCETITFAVQKHCWLVLNPHLIAHLLLI